MRILYGYAYYDSPAFVDVGRLKEDHLAELRRAGFEVEGFCLTLNPPGPHLAFPQMDRLWRRGDRTLLAMYERLEERLSGFDVLLNSSGLNLHPEFIERLPAYTVFQCFDDPESSAILSRPVAASYDLSLVGNIAEVDTYRSWGVKAAEWMPMGLMPGSYDPSLRAEDILSEERDIDLIMFIDRNSLPRRPKLDRLAEAFPNEHFYGQGWARGCLPVGPEQVRLFRRAKIGPNLHHSTGPINFRVFQAPANGVMQICDNKSHLGQVYELDKEVAGFDTVDECIDLCRYYLAHDRQRREIAAAGFLRAVRDYNEVAVFRRTVEVIAKYRSAHVARPAETAIAVRQHQSTRGRRALYRLISPALQLGRLSLRLAKTLLRPVYRRLRRAFSS